MKKNYKHLMTWLIITGLVCYLSVSAFGERRRQVLTGTRPLGMAGAFLTVTDDSHAITWNPAAMPFVRHQELAIGRNDAYGLGISDNHVAYLLPITDRHAVGIDWLNTGFDDEELNFGENRVSFAYSYNLLSTLSLGASVKYLSQSQGLDGIPFSTASGTGVDVGLIVSPLRNLRLGVVAHDAADTWVKFSKSENRDRLYRRNIRLGASYKPIDSLTLAVDLDEGVHAGAEYWIGLPVHSGPSESGVRSTSSIQGSPSESRNPSGSSRLVNFAERFLIGVRGGVYHNFDTADGVRYAVGGSLKYSFLENASLRLDYAFQSHPVLPDTHRFTGGVAFELTRSLVKIKQIDTEEIFATLYRRYGFKSMGDVVLQNKQRKPLKDVTVSFFIPGYMSGPVDIKTLDLPGKTAEEADYSETIPIQPRGYNTPLENDILRLPIDTSTQMKIIVSYDHGGEEQRVEKAALISIRRSGLVPINRSVAPIAALIDPDDPIVEEFANTVTSADGDEVTVDMQDGDRISWALQIYNALNVYKISYVPDANQPFDLENPTDHVKYPGQILTSPKDGRGRRGGDCDDETALYAALLERIGVHTRLVGTPGHVFVMFDTGIHKDKAASLSLPKPLLPEKPELPPSEKSEPSPGRYILLEDSSHVWIPVEVTRLGQPERSTFIDAWDTGLKVYDAWKDTPHLDVVPVRQAWKDYPRSHPRAPDESGIDMADLPQSKLDQAVKNDISALQAQRDKYLSDLRERGRQNKDDFEAAIQLAKTLSMRERDREAINAGIVEAIAILEDIRRRDPNNATALNSLGNLYTIQGDNEAAKSVYREAREAAPEDGCIQVNQGLAYRASGDDEQGNQMIAAGIEQSGGAAHVLDCFDLPTEEPADVGDATRMAENQLRILIQTLSGESNEMTPLPRASEVGGEGKFYLYWK